MTYIHPHTWHQVTFMYSLNHHARGMVMSLESGSWLPYLWALTPALSVRSCQLLSWLCLLCLLSAFRVESGPREAWRLHTLFICRPWRPIWSWDLMLSSGFEKLRQSPSDMGIFLSTLACFSQPLFFLKWAHEPSGNWCQCSGLSPVLTLCFELALHVSALPSCWQHTSHSASLWS